MAIKLIENEERKSFENALFLALKNHGLLLPVDQQKTNVLVNDDSGEEIELPKRLDDPEKFLPKRGKTIPFTPDNKLVKKVELKYRKVASRAGSKKRKKK